MNLSSLTDSVVKCKLGITPVVHFLAQPLKIDVIDHFSPIALNAAPRTRQSYEISRLPSPLELRASGAAFSPRAESENHCSVVLARDDSELLERLPVPPLEVNSQKEMNTALCQCHLAETPALCSNPRQTCIRRGLNLTPFLASRRQERSRFSTSRSTNFRSSPPGFSGQPRRNWPRAPPRA